MDSLMTGSYRMSDLQAKYHNFMVPDFSISVEGTKVGKSATAPNLFLDNVKIKLSRDAAGSLSFDVLNAYDLEARQFQSRVKQQFLVGKVITAQIGYAGSLTQVFKGFIHSVSYEYSDSPVISVTALDVIRLMQDNEVIKKTYENQNPTDVFRQIMGNYKPLCTASDVTADPSSSPKELIIQKGTDYSFVKDVLCAMECRDFYVLNGCAYFVDVEKKKSSILTLEWGKDILSFSYEQNYLDKNIRINLADRNKQTSSIVFEEKVSGKNQKKALSVPTVKNISMEAEGTAQEAKRQLARAVVEQKQDSIRCSGSCIGIPQIVPGRSLTIAKLDSEIDGTYEVMSVEQNIGTDGFTTQFELGGKV